MISRGLAPSSEAATELVSRRSWPAAGAGAAAEAGAADVGREAAGGARGRERAEEGRPDGARDTPAREWEGDAAREAHWPKNLWRPREGAAPARKAEAMVKR